MRAIAKLLMVFGLVGIAATAILMIWFGIRSDYYFPDRYEDAFATYAVVVVSWAGYGVACAAFLSLQALLARRKNNKPNKSQHPTA